MFPAAVSSACQQSLPAVAPPRCLSLLKKYTTFPVLPSTHRYADRRPTDLDQTTLTFCPNVQFGGDPFLQYGSCCTQLEEDAIEVKFLEAGTLTPECDDLYKQVLILYDLYLCTRVYFLLLIVASCLLSSGVTSHREYSVWSMYILYRFFDRVRTVQVGGCISAPTSVPETYVIAILLRQMCDNAAQTS